MDCYAIILPSFGNFTSSQEEKTKTFLVILCSFFLVVHASKDEAYYLNNRPLCRTERKNNDLHTQNRPEKLKHGKIKLRFFFSFFNTRKEMH